MAGEVAARILSDFSEIARLWKDAEAVHGAPQSLEWIDNWRAIVNADSFVVGLFHGTKPILLVPLEAVSHRGVKIARYPGGSHANCNFPWLSKEYNGVAGRDAVNQLLGIIRKVRPDIDAVSLTRQFSEMQGAVNPLLALGKAPNPNPVLAVSLNGGFDAVLDRANRKRKLKKHRQHDRRYEESGGWRIDAPQSPAESEKVLDLFFAMKARRFRQMGISDPFADEKVRRFFKAFFCVGLTKDHQLNELRFLEVGGTIRSIIGKVFGVAGPTVEFGAIAQDELMTASPGEFLFFEDISRSCGEGHSVYSFGIGDEPYKREWCDIDLAIYDTLVPLSAKGRFFTALQSARNAVAGSLKRNPRLWGMAKALRSRFAKR
ncbi:CelD/BcsL family acetyltransferase involved in cellulose biosynthesis [Ochrobactrum intermedium]|uniref:CelD/BcsL family acetyltransferase involved in cellulose biosynthesis n=1 Tax=Brucella intermedia TaxID=94625 RepID=A0ABR6AKW7_9HYPH|nr:GNAT family N-acetyltransferase [Brucella intermedia]MBA8850038.1 CelD/BcsL family acetyltransferase involved in cellulose biosynthesis [Brucella intermedia]